jgi:hypothetical protein
MTDQSEQKLYDRISELEARVTEAIKRAQEAKEALNDVRIRVVRLEMRWQGIKERWLTLD